MMSNLYFRGDNVFLYTQFIDSKGESIDVDNPVIKILHDKRGNIDIDVNWSPMERISTGEYCYNFKISNNADLGQYQVLYAGTINGNLSHTMEIFHVGFKSQEYSNSIKLYGYVHDIKVNVPLCDVGIEIICRDTDEYVLQSLTNEVGYWETFLYPGNYIFKFIKSHYITSEINVEIGNEHNEIQFNNIGLEAKKYKKKGNGLYRVGDKYVTKDGTPLPELQVKIYDVINPQTIIAEDVTDEEGAWECFLNTGLYLLKVNGYVFNSNFNKVFRIKVDNNGDFQFEDLSKNIISSNNVYIGKGDGSVEISDLVLDKNNNPIIDVQVNAFKVGKVSDDSIIAQTYTDVHGKWSLNLDPGNYEIEYYHPNFKVILEKLQVK